MKLTVFEVSGLLIYAWPDYTLQEMDMTGFIHILVLASLINWGLFETHDNFDFLNMDGPFFNTQLKQGVCVQHIWKKCPWRRLRRRPLDAGLPDQARDRAQGCQTGPGTGPRAALGLHKFWLASCTYAWTQKSLILYTSMYVCMYVYNMGKIINDCSGVLMITLFSCFFVSLCCWWGENLHLSNSA